MSLNRRGLLGALGFGAASLTVASCSTPERRPAPPRPSTSAKPSTPASSSAPPPAELDLGTLGNSLNGKVIQSGQPGYDKARQLFNPVFDDRGPKAVAQCADEQDVRACVRAAAAARTPIAARGGGHSYAGYSAPDGALVVDTSRLAGVRVQSDGTAIIGAGTRLESVYSALAKAGRALPAGSCPTVGIAGLTMGGGVGVLTRKYGLTCDRLRELRLVTADGTARTVSARQEPDLFWALRGGGGGNLGIVTELRFATVPAPRLTTLTMSFGAGSAAKVFDAWQRWLPGAPAEFWTKCSVTSGTSPAARISGCFVGDQNGLQPLLAELRQRIGTPAKTVHLRERSFGQAMEFFSGSSARDSFSAGSRVLSAPIDAGKLTSLLRGKTGVSIMFDALGGVVAEVGETETAFPHRKALATVQIYAGPDDTERVRRIRDGMGAGGGYVNYIDTDHPDWARAYYGQNAARLRRIAERYDPNGVFDFAQGLREI